jgi:hypothetical protein
MTDQDNPVHPICQVQRTCTTSRRILSFAQQSMPSDTCSGPAYWVTFGENGLRSP